MQHRLVSRRLVCLTALSLVAGAALPCRAGMVSASPLPMGRGVDIVIQGTNLSTTVALRFDGIAAPIVGTPTRTKLVTRVPEGLAFPPEGTATEVVICRDFTPGPTTECKTGAVAGEVFLAPQPPLLGSVPLPVFATGVAKDRDLVAVAAPNTGLHVVDVHKRSAPVWVGTLELPGARAVELRAGVAYVATADGLVIVDLTHAAAPEIIGTLPLGHPAETIDLDGNVAYLLWGDIGVVSQGDLSLVDVTDSTSPVLLSVVDPVPPAFFYGESGLAVGGGFAYVGTTGGEGPSGVVVVDVKNTANPVVLGPSGFAFGPGLAVRNKHLLGTLYSDTLDQNCVDLGCYLVTLGHALHVASLSDPAAPSEVASLHTAWDDGGTQSLVATGGASFVESDGNLIIADVTSPATPQFVTLLDAGPSSVRAYDVESCTVAAALQSGELALFDLNGVANATSRSLCDDEDGDEDEDGDDTGEGQEDLDVVGDLALPIQHMAAGKQ